MSNLPLGDGIVKLSIAMFFMWVAYLLIYTLVNGRPPEFWLAP